MAQRRFQRGRGRRRGLNRLLSNKGWLLLWMIVGVVTVALTVFGIFGNRGALSVLDGHRRANAAIDAEGRQPFVGAAALRFVK